MLKLRDEANQSALFSKKLREVILRLCALKRSSGRWYQEQQCAVGKLKDEPAYQLSMTINPEATGISPSLLENTAPLKPRPTDDAADIEASCLVMADKEACWMCSSVQHTSGT
ncbi:hypothetical protein V6N11_031980 [Hibiscus sabdariffa]|uniref:Uncharacterized protein n=1 Tax=Hibiscus sabdariffa TaxID=183260 RepID=A0ABR2SZK5_9ROSI